MDPWDNGADPWSQSRVAGSNGLPEGYGHLPTPPQPPHPQQAVSIVSVPTDAGRVAPPVPSNLDLRQLLTAAAAPSMMPASALQAVQPPTLPARPLALPPTQPSTAPTINTLMTSDPPSWWRTLVPAAATTVNISTPRMTSDAQSPRFETPISQTSLEDTENRLEQAGAIAAAPTPASSGTSPTVMISVPAHLLECPVCLQRFEHARVLGRCGHTLCTTCLQGLRGAHDLATRCPVCRRDVADGDDHPNFVVQAILGEVEPQRLPPGHGDEVIAGIQQASGSRRSAERDRQRREQTQLLTSMFGRGGSYPWWPTDEPIATLLARTALADGRHGPILDIGAYGNLTGDRWAQEQARRAVRAGYKPTQRKMNKSMSVSGVGKGAQSVEWEVTLPIAVTDSDDRTLLDDFTSPVIPDSDVPGLLGLCTIQRLRGLIDTFNDPPKLYCCGPGGYEIKLSPGSREFPLFGAPSGHMILPTSEFDKINKQPGDQPRERALATPDEPMHLQATASSSREHGPPLDENEAAVQMD